MTKPITTREATLKTVSVQVRALSLGHKQMTMTVFRQIALEALIDADAGTFLGVPWGRVNYFWGTCRDDHLHIVWQKGDELRRACIFGPDLPHWEYHGCRDMYYELRTARCRGVRVRLAWQIASGELDRSTLQEGPTSVLVGGVQLPVSLHAASIRELRDVRIATDIVADSFGNRHNFQLRRLEDEYKKALDAIADIPDCDNASRKRVRDTWDHDAWLLGCYDQERQYDEKVKTRQRNWKVRYEELLDLDQLFISV